ncbi:Outer membrane stress sensor protease DegS [hydrothermal vent metagenome]|uniref:Outer membrane stress sensor protease DegS n=1 Tax=hydrothermal vent metagenome TaxID=652676 RepID=A0A3B0ZTH5_9ZZZZ
MKITKNLIFIFQFATVGLAAAFILIYMYPHLLSSNQTPTTVEIKESRHKHDKNKSQAVISYADAVDTAAPAVVNIQTSKIITRQTSPLLNDPFFRRFFSDRNQSKSRQEIESSLGSGVIINQHGYILTNNHVIAGADEILVALKSGEIKKAKIVGTDPETDIAVLKIQGDNLPAITLGKDKELRVGDVVLAIGNPFGVGQTVTSGIVSATGRDMLGINTFENFIQTDAAINPGNSGGALINPYGELIGINTAIFSRSGGSQGIGFAIPVSLAKNVMQQIIEHGLVVRGWLGVAIQSISPDLAESLGLKSTNGIIITNIIVNGPADKAKLTRGDVITKINGIELKNVRHALNTISLSKPGDKLKIEGVRRGKVFDATAIAIQRPPPVQSISRR